MKPRQRFVTALNGGTPDRMPVFDFLFSPKLQKELLGYTTELYDGESQVKLATLLGLHCAPSAHMSIGTFPDGTVRLSWSTFATVQQITKAGRAVLSIAAGR